MSIAPIRLPHPPRVRLDAARHVLSPGAPRRALATVALTFTVALAAGFVAARGTWPTVAVLIVAFAAGAASRLGALLARRRERARPGETELRLVADALPVLVASVDRAGRYRYVNAAYGRWFGVDPGTFFGRTVQDVLGAGYEGTVREHLERAFGGRVERYRTRFASPALGLRDLDVTYVPQFVDGQVDGVVTLIADVTDEVAAEQRLRESEARLQLAMEGAGMGTWYRDASAGTLVWDRQHARLLGIDPERVARPSDALWLSLVHPADRRRALRVIRRAERTAGTFGLELRILRADTGEERWLALHGRVLAADGGGAATQSLGVVFDVTEARRADAERRGRAEALREADRRKDEFLATLAHELRNPLAPIRYAVRLVRPDAPAAALEQARATIERQSTHMARLLDDLLDVSRITRGAIELKREVLDLGRAVADAVEVARPMIARVPHRLLFTAPERPVCVDADPTRLAQVVANLLENAAKYTEPGGVIAVTVAEDGAHAVVSVKDTGIGLAPGMRARVFELFSQVHQSLVSPRGGLGIGLAIVRRLVELHGGTVEVLSEGLGHGSEFVVRLPRVDAPAAVAPQAPGFAAGGARRVLVVDDNEDAVDSLATVLRLHGHAVQVAYDGAAAIALAEREHPDAVVLDLGLPRLSGFEVARWLRRQPWGADVRLVAVTGWGQAADRRRTREAGFDGHCTKPVDPDELLGWIADAPPAAAQG
jgi:PAS domain S-box-containing protein